MKKLTKQRKVFFKHMPSVILLPVVLLLISGSVFADGGDMKWHKTYDLGSETVSISKVVKATDDGGFIIACEHTTSDRKSRILVIKTDASGDTLWTKYYGWGDDYYYTVGLKGIEQLSDGGYIIGGTRFWYLEEIEDAEAVLIKTDANGDTLWTRSYGRDNSSEYIPAYSCFSVHEISDGGFIIGGCMTKESTEGGLGHYDGLVIKTDTNGDSLWARTFGEDIDSTAYIFYNTLETTNGGFIVGGYRQWLDLEGDDAWYKQPYLMKLSANGDSLWSCVYRQSATASIFDLIITSDGGYAYSGSMFDDVSWNQNLTVGKADSVGNELWYHEFNNGVENDSILFTNEGTSLVQTEDNGFLVAGIMNYADTDLRTYKNPLILRLDASGDSVWFNNYYDEIGYAAFFSAALTEDGSFVAAGGNYVPGDGYTDALIAKFDLMVSIDDNPVILPDEFTLMQNYPNPFNMSTVISYELKSSMEVKLDVYDLLGRIVETLVDEKQTAGVYHVNWYADDIASGMYFYKLQAGDYTKSMKMSLVK